jgi:phosphohistidine phosphatase
MKNKHLFVLIMSVTGICGQCRFPESNVDHVDAEDERTIYLVRHAKSCWDDARLKDIDRPLNKRGLRDAPDMGKRLHEKGIQVQLIFSSPAKRAYHTASIIAGEIQFDPRKIIHHEEIYEATTKDLLNIIQAFDDSMKSVMLVGHNPGFTALANYLTKEYFDNVPTCGIVAISFSSSWNQIGRNSGKLIFFDYPKKNRDEQVE